MFLNPFTPYTGHIFNTGLTISGCSVIRKRLSCSEVVKSFLISLHSFFCVAIPFLLEEGERKKESFFKI